MLHQALQQNRARGTALLATNFYNFETLEGILQAAEETGASPLLQTSPSTLRYTGIETAVALARGALLDHGLKGWLHLDHARDLDLIRRCLEAGYDSVMIDASEEDFATNVALTRQVLRMAEPFRASVEAELGYIPKLGQAEVGRDQFTTAKEAARFHAETGVHALAVSIGTAHGFYKETPHIDLQRLEQIAAAVEIPLVLHGGSGVPAQQWRAARARGIAKINFATEIKDTFTRRLKEALAHTEEIDLRQTFPPAIAAVKALVADKYRVCLHME